MSRLIAIALMLISVYANAQNSLWSPDSLSTASPNFAMDRYNQLLVNHDPLMYLVYPHIEPINTRKIPLRDGEGKDGYWLEGNFSNRFVIHRGKYYNPGWLQRLRLTFDVAITPRLTRDSSSPLLPSNNRFGLGLDLLLSPVSNLIKNRSTAVWLTTQMMHYSNGHADSAFILDDEGNQRNNYRSGDFSTNYLRALLNIAHVSVREHVVSAAIGWQREIDIKGPLGFNPAQYNSYGKHRALFSFQWLRASRLVTRNSIFTTSTKKVAKQRQFSFRTEMEYIVGDLSSYPHEHKYRFGCHGYLTYMPSITNEVGFLIHAYTGRDYLNIRYDDIVFIGEIGLYMRINKR